VVAGAGYAGLHVALRLTARLPSNPAVELTLVDRHDYHQVITELPRVAGGTRAADAVRIPLQDMLSERVGFVQTEITGFDLPGRRLLTGAGPVGWRRLVLALGSRPNDFAIPGLAQRTLSLYSAGDAERVWQAVGKALTAAAAAADPARQRRLATVVVGGGGATGVELADELAEILPKMASGRGLASGRPAVQLVEVGPTISAGSSPQLARRWPATWTRSWRAARWRRSPSTTRDSSSRSGPAAGSPTSPTSPAAGTWPTCSKTPSSGSTASPSRTCAAGTQ
jgi:NADH dehydrogenase